MKFPIFILIALSSTTAWCQLDFRTPEINQNVYLDSTEISFDKYVEAIADQYSDPVAYANSIVNENGKIWMYYEKPLPKKKKKVYHSSIPLSLNRGFEAAELLTGTSITGLNFDTEASTSGFYHIPPDVHGAAGTSHIGYVVNTAIDFYTKAGVSAPGYPQSLATFFSSLSPATGTFDPKILWDQYENRWLVVTLEQDTGPNLSKIFLAVSATADPTGSWYYQAIDAAQTIGANDCWFDYPGFAIDEEAIYVTGNYFEFSGNGSCSSSQVLIVDKGTSGGFYDGIVLVDDDPANSGGAFTFYDPVVEAGGNDVTNQPAHTFGTAPSGLGTYLVGYSGLSGGGNEFLQFYAISNPLSSPTFTQFYKSLGDIEAVGLFDDIPQSGGIDIESNDRRTLNSQWANNELWTCFNMQHASGTNAGQISAYYVNINASGSTSSSVSIDNHGAVDGEDISSGMETWNPAICIDNSDNGAMVFSACDGSNFASSYVVAIDESSGSIGPSTLLAAGTDTYERTFGGGSNRWGDYAGITIDPSDGDIWAFSQVALSGGTPLGGSPEDGRWGVFIEEFQGLVLPIDLLSFDAERTDNQVEFVWETVNEYDCASYEIEYLHEGLWTSIHDQPCNNSMHRNTYKASFLLDRYGTFMFRLKQIDFDQSFSYSDVLSIDYRDQTSDKDVLIYPNPFSSDLSIEIHSNWNQSSILALLDASGKTVFTKDLALLRGKNTASIELSDLKSGIYTLKLSNASGITYQKVIKTD